LEDSHIEPALVRAWRCLSDKFASLLENFNPTVLEYYNTYINARDVLNGPQLLRCLLVRGEQELDKFGVFELLSLCPYSLGHEKDAESKFRKAIKMTVKVYGKDNSLVLNLKTRLDIWLRKWGRGVEAHILKAEIDKILGLDVIALHTS
jgi:hypothetical protein